VNELFRHDDHAGDIVPLRRLRPSAAQPEPAPGTTSTGRGTGAFVPGVRTTPVRPVPSYSTPSTMKIELEVESPASTRPPGHGSNRPDASGGAEISALTLVKWFIAILVVGQLFWWIYSFLHTGVSQTP
jgi:hypothetical protein